MAYKVIHRPKIGKFLIRLEPGKFAFLGYTIKDNKIYIESTCTPPEYRGRGIAARLMEAVVEWAREKRLKVVPVCSYSLYFFKKHEEAWDVLDPEAISSVRNFELRK